MSRMLVVIPSHHFRNLQYPFQSPKSFSIVSNLNNTLNTAPYTNIIHHITRPEPINTLKMAPSAPVS